MIVENNGAGMHATCHKPNAWSLDITGVGNDPSGTYLPRIYPRIH